MIYITNVQYLIGLVAAYLVTFFTSDTYISYISTTLIVFALITVKYIRLHFISKAIRAYIARPEKGYFLVVKDEKKEAFPYSLWYVLNIRDDGTIEFIVTITDEMEIMPIEVLVTTFESIGTSVD